MIYLDNMATTGLDPRVLEAMLPFLKSQEGFANPASRHALGRLNAQKIITATAEIEKLLNAAPNSLVWTSSATESANLAIKGLSAQYPNRRHILTTSIEHKATLETLNYLNQCGYVIETISPDPKGLFSVDSFAARVQPETLLLCFHHVNNEVGVIQDVASIGAWAKQQNLFYYVDAAQSLGKASIDITEWQADLASFSAHKAYGPKGIALLYIRPDPSLQLVPLLHGGGQQKGVRSSTLSPALIIGMLECVRLAIQEYSSDCAKVQGMRDLFWRKLQQVSGIHLNGDAKQRVPHNLNFSVDAIDGESLMLAIDERIAVSSASACVAASILPSHVLLALGCTPQQAHRSLRVSFGRFNTLEEVDLAADILIANIQMLRKISGDHQDV